jgi:hypothetical protein
MLGGDWIEIGRRQGVVRTIEPMLGQSEMRLVMQVLEDR